ncbi:MAG TPA: SDR family oxidoreductase, partial [Reyranella sp.]|nr:SDR family oxidoreductase [Reyranella sp.]
DIEVGYIGARRLVVRGVQQPASTLPAKQIPQGGNWVFTGGARGITAVVARELGRRFGLKLNLIGSSPLPQVDPSWRNLDEAGLKALKGNVMKQARTEGKVPVAAWAKVEKAIEIDKTTRAFAEAGVKATYHSCNVADRAALAQVLDGIRKADGPIAGIVHGAGFEAAAKLPRKKPENVATTITVKVDGAINLMELTAADPVRYFVGFSSLAGLLGGVGQSDYAMANAMLAKLADHYRVTRPDCGSTAIYWPAWDEIGMAARPESRLALEMFNNRFMPPLEGVAHVIDELSAGVPEGEIGINDETCYPRDRIVSLDQAAKPAPAAQPKTAPAAKPSKRPVIDSIERMPDGRGLIAKATFDPKVDPFLIHHKLRGKPILPAVIAIEAMAEAASFLDDRVVVGVRDVDIVSGLKYLSDDPQTVRVETIATPEGADCRILVDFLDRRGRLVEANRVLVTGKVELAKELPAVSFPPPGEPALGWFNVTYANDAPIHHGPPMKYLKNIYWQYDGGMGRIVAPPLEELAGARGGEGWIFAPAMLDGALYACTIFAWALFKKRAEIPQGFGALRMHRAPRPGETCTQRFYFKGMEGINTWYDFQVFGADNTPIMSGEGYRCVVVSEGEK